MWHFSFQFFSTPVLNLSSASFTYIRMLQLYDFQQEQHTFLRV